jgi:hypothetical protein
VSPEPEAHGPEAHGKVAPWRIGLGVAILGAMAYLAALFAPIYFSNLELQNYVADVTQTVENRDKPDDLLRARVLQKASELDLPVKASNVQITRPGGALRIEVRYVVQIQLPGYTADVHFHPGAGSR